MNLEEADTRGQATKTLDHARDSLSEIETIISSLRDPIIFSRLISFVAYYGAIIEYYTDNIEDIIPVKDLLLLKYIDMMKDILLNFDENISTQTQRTEIHGTLKTINEKLYSTLGRLKEQQTFDLNVDLKTIQDLIKSDF